MPFKKHSPWLARFVSEEGTFVMTDKSHCFVFSPLLLFVFLPRWQITISIFHTPTRKCKCNRLPPPIKSTQYTAIVSCRSETYTIDNVLPPRSHVLFLDYQSRGWVNWDFKMDFLGLWLGWSGNVETTDTFIYMLIKWQHALKCLACRWEGKGTYV